MSPLLEEQELVEVAAIDFQLQHASKWDGPDGYLWPDHGIKHWYVDQPREWNMPETFTINYLITSASF